MRTERTDENTPRQHPLTVDYTRHPVAGLGRHTLAKLSPQHLQLFYAQQIAAGLLPTAAESD